MGKGMSWEMTITIIIAVLLILVAVYAGMFYVRKSTLNLAQSLEDQVQELLGDSLGAQVEELRELNLTGESLENYERIAQRYREVVNGKFPDIQMLIEEVRASLPKYHLIAARQNLKAAQDSFLEAKEVYQGVLDSVNAMQGKMEQHRQKKANLKQRYKDIRKILLTKNFSFGPAMPKLEELFAEINKEFTNYGDLMEQGDYGQADQSLQELENQTASIDKLLEVIPPLYRNLHNVFPEQLKEIKAGYLQLKKDGYNFLSEIDQEVGKLETKVQEEKQFLTDLQVTEAQDTDKTIRESIEDLYKQIETEYAARHKVEKRKSKWGEFIRHAEKQEKQLLLDLDRIGQHYELTHDEVERARDLDTKLHIIRKNYTQALTEIEMETAVYSRLENQQNDDFDALKQIEEEQGKIHADISALVVDEKKAWDGLAGFQGEIHEIKRQTMSKHLPGYPQSYYEKLDYIENLVNALMEEMNHVKIDMSVITTQMLETENEMRTFQKERKEMYQAAVMAENLIQYGNRYRDRYPHVKEASQRATELFTRDFEYVQAVDVMAEALEKVEPGLFERIATKYLSKEEATELMKRDKAK
ncbi:septation ring formation regulator EzrA [Ligilactobacillus equi]|uniref:Septation ring formation regulator EzrA n=2 Tax=Ligilactobacillus equi TaxID=137357 RepID=A0A0R1TPP8_9LACO|nr:septation ring formation regulator EzrA [Ligilactobacillus equi]KRL80514.1 septation ring formation regulator EzrA [Ligilactobacillus equi DSM 15833 = JCM 10991]